MGLGFGALLPAIAATLLLAAPAAAQEGAPADGPYTQVFFQTGSAEIDPRAVQELSKWAAAARDHPGQRVVVSGYADTVGSLEANRALSDRRARAVAGALIDLGVDPNAISLEAQGESDGAVPTADEVSEPLNRRVSVALAASLGGCVGGSGRPVCAPQRGIPLCPGDRRCKRGRPAH